MRHITRKHFYTSEDWKLMQAAHLSASRLLHRSAQTHEDANRLARRIMMLFDAGLRDQKVMAKVAAHQEQIASLIDARRRSENEQNRIH